MERINYVILGGGIAAGYALQELVEQGAASGDILMISSDSALPYSRPALSKGFLAGKKQQGDILINPPEFYKDHGIEVKLNATATRVDLDRSTVLLKSGEVIGFNKLLLATGSNVRPLTAKGVQTLDVAYLRQIDDAHLLRSRIGKAHHCVVIGGGFIGMEVASVIAGHGKSVQMVFPEQGFLGGMMTEPMMAFFRTYYEDRGVRVLSGERVERLSGDDKETTVHLASGKTLTADLVVAGVGAVPAIELLNPDKIALNQGVVVNEYLETSSPNVYAAGDIAYYPDAHFDKRRHVEHWQTAVDQGKIAARNMTGKRDAYRAVPYFFSDIFDLSWEFWGDPDEADEVLHVGDMKSGSFSAWWVREGKVQATFVQGRPDEERDLAKQCVDDGAELPEEIRKAAGA